MKVVRSLFSRDLKSITASSTLVENVQDHKVQNLINNDNSLARVEGAPGNDNGEKCWEVKDSK